MKMQVVLVVGHVSPDRTSITDHAGIMPPGTTFNPMTLKEHGPVWYHKRKWGSPSIVGYDLYVSREDGGYDLYWCKKISERAVKKGKESVPEAVTTGG